MVSHLGMRRPQLKRRVSASLRWKEQLNVEVGDTSRKGVLSANGVWHQQVLGSLQVAKVADNLQWPWDALHAHKWDDSVSLSESMEQNIQGCKCWELAWNIYANAL